MSVGHSILSSHAVASYRAIEVDVDALSDGQETFIAAIMEHIEEAGIHSGDSSCSLPAHSLATQITDRIRTYTRELSKRLTIIGLMNVQFAVQGDAIYLLEVNPRASRTVPFVSKATGKPIAQLAAKIILGHTCKELGIQEDLDLNLELFNVKVPVFPFRKFPGVDTLLGPEMKSTGEVMGRGKTFAEAYSRALHAAGMQLPRHGTVFLSVRDEDKPELLPLAQKLKALGFKIEATRGTAQFLNSYHIGVTAINKLRQGSPHCVEAILANQYSWVVNTTSTDKTIFDSFEIRRAVLDRKIPSSSLITSARAMIQAIESQKNQTELPLYPLERKKNAQ